MHGLPKNVCVVPVIPVVLYVHSICFVCVCVCWKLSPHLGV